MTGSFGLGFSGNRPAVAVVLSLGWPSDRAPTKFPWLSTSSNSRLSPRRSGSSTRWLHRLSAEGEGPTALAAAMSDTDANRSIRNIQAILDPYCLFAVTINPESRVSVVEGPAERNSFSRVGGRFW